MLILLGIIVGAIGGGALTGAFEGAVMGAVLGGVAVYFLRNRATGETAATPDADRIALLERKVQYLYDQLLAVQRQLNEIKAGDTAEALTKMPSEQEAAAVFGGESTQAPPRGTPESPSATPIETLAASVRPEAMPLDVPAAKSESESASEPHPEGPPPAETRAPELQRDPSVFDRLMTAVREWFTGGNTVVRVGIVVLFFGLAFLLKYAYDRTQVPPELRVIAVALGGALLLYLGWRLRTRRAAYAQALQGGGIGALYLTVFGALKLYQLLPAGPAFGLMICIAAFSAVLAVAQNAQALALLGAAGGFLAPVLASTGEGSHVMLFSYYLLLNAGILAIALFKAWRMLNFIGFFFTFGIALAWGIRTYRPEHFASTEPFLLGFFALYLTVSVLFALRQAPRLRHYLDGTLVFGLPIVAFGMQVELMRPYPYGAAWSALGLGCLYLVLARLLWGRHQETLRTLVEAFLALGVVFATLAIPLALDGRWTSAAWALEGAALVWVGVKQGRLSARLFGVLLQLGAAVAFAGYFDQLPTALPVANSAFLGALFLGVAGLFSAYVLERYESILRSWERHLATLGFVWGLAWWGVSGVGEIDRQLHHLATPHAVLLFATASIALLIFLHERLPWRMARWVAYGLLPIAFLMVFADAAEGVSQPLAQWGWLVWPLVLACHLWLLRPGRSVLEKASGLWHAAGLWLLAVVLIWSLSWGVEAWTAERSVWALVASMIPSAATVWLLATQGERLPWPVRGHQAAYLLAGCLPLLLFMGFWILLSNAAHNGDPAPLPYLPVLNPLDLAQLAVLLVTVFWYRGSARLGVLDSARWARGVYALIGIAAFVVANAMLLRAVHHWAGVPYDWNSMMSSMVVQTALSIFWTVLALCTMVIASRLVQRILWIIGAGLMAVVVVKLFLVDLSAIGGVERIISFIGVGVLMLVVGYLSPVPPKRVESAP